MEIDRQYLDPSAGSKWVSLCQVDARTIHSLIILHIPQSESRATLSVLAGDFSGSDNPESRIRAGISSVPKLVASIEWTPTAVAGGTGPERRLLTFKGSSQPWPLRASPSTFLEWARTARDSDALQAMIRKEESNDKRDLSYSVERLAPDGLALRKETATGNFELRKTTDDQPVWLVGRQPDRNQPLHVQRHLAAIYTRNSEGLGRVFEVYAGAQLLRQTRLQPLKEAAGKPADLDGLRIAEFEVPSIILASGSNAIPNRFLNPYLDLKATGGDKVNNDGDKPVTYRFFVRFACSPNGMRDVTSARLTIKGLPGNQPHEVTLVDQKASGAPSNPVRAVEVVLTKMKDSTFKRYHRCLLWDTPEGGFKTFEELKDPFKWHPNTGFELSLDASTSNNARAELWADVSLLHSSKSFDPASPDEFDFDWLFSTAAGNADIRDKTSAEGLNELIEAQARIVAWSSPIRRVE